jgi:hypothetical protein
VQYVQVVLSLQVEQFVINELHRWHMKVVSNAYDVL